MYTAELDQASFKIARRSAPSASRRSWIGSIAAGTNYRTGTHYQVHTALPDKFITALEQAITTITDYLLKTEQAYGGRKLQRFYFDALHFSRVSELFDEHSLFDVTGSHKGSEDYRES